MEAQKRFITNLYKNIDSYYELELKRIAESSEMNEHPPVDRDDIPDPDLK